VPRATAARELSAEEQARSPARSPARRTGAHWWTAHTLTVLWFLGQSLEVLQPKRHHVQSREDHGPLLALLGVRPCASLVLAPVHENARGGRPLLEMLPVSAPRWRIPCAAAL
jgi:hypothetical protein